MAISQNFPEEGPTLNLNFAGSKTLDPRITFSRTTTGTYMDANGLIVTAPADAPRFDHRYVNGEIESLGLLVEEERSNLFTRSEEITTAYFGGGGTIGTDTILNPYGISSSVSYVTTSERVRNFDADGYSTLAFSFFSKKRFGGLERDYTRIEIFQVAVGGGSLASYDFNFDGNNSDGTYFKDVKTEQYPNGWYRFSCRLVARSDYNGGTFSTTSRVDIEGGASDNYVWGIQVEAASFATSYIPTSGSTVTREPDRAVIEGSNFTDIFNTNFEHFSMFVNYDNTDTDDGTNYNIIEFWGESTNYDNRVEFYKDNDSPYHIETRAFGGGSAIFSNGNLSAGSTAATQKLATSWSVDYSTSSGASRRWAFSFNGESVDVVNDATGTTIPSLTRIGFGKNPTRTDFDGGKIHFKQISLYSNTLTDSQLQNLTK